MSDIFLLYIPDDREKAAKLAAAFEQQHLTVAWDFPDGVSFVAEVKGAKVIIVLWSQAAGSRPMHLKLIQTVRFITKYSIPVIVLMEKADLPPVYSSDSFDLSGWDGRMNAELKRLLHHVRARIGTSLPAAPPASIEEVSLSEIQENARPAVQEATRAQPGDEKTFSGVFISYRRNEASAYAGRMSDRLAARFGKGKVFIDTENVGWGEDFVEAITEAAESCAVMIALISPRWLRGGQEEVDDYVRLEVATALGRRIRVIPILIQGASMPAPKELPEDLSPLVRRNALALSDTRWERDVEDLIKTLEGLLKD